MGKLKIGDVIEILLPQKKKAFCQYLFTDKIAMIVQIFNMIVTRNKIVELQSILDSGNMFPPVAVMLKKALNHENWKVIGNLPIKDNTYHPFVSACFNSKTGKSGRWFLWNGNEHVLIGRRLTKKYKCLEYHVIWPAGSIVKRIVTREPPFPYADLIAHNRFTPKKIKPYKGKKLSFWGK